MILSRETWINREKRKNPSLRASTANLLSGLTPKTSQPATTGTKMPWRKMDRCKKARTITISGKPFNRICKVVKIPFWWTTSKTKGSPVKMIWISKLLPLILNNCCSSNICFSNSTRWTNCNCCNSDSSNKVTCLNFCKKKSLNSTSRSTSYKTPRYPHQFLASSWTSRLVVRRISSKITRWIQLLPKESQTWKTIMQIALWISRIVQTPWGRELTPQRKTTKWISWAALEALWHPILKMLPETKVEIKTQALQFHTQITATVGSEVLVWVEDLQKMFSRA